MRLMLAGLLLGIVHDRRLMREAQVNIAIRWFIGYGLHEHLPDHSSLTRIRQRWGTSPSDDGKRQWPGSETSRPCRNSLPSTPRSTTTHMESSTTNANSTAATSSSRTARPPWPNGVNLQPLRGLDCRFFSSYPVSLAVPRSEEAAWRRCAGRKRFPRTFADWQIPRAQAPHGCSTLAIVSQHPHLVAVEPGVGAVT